MAAYTIDKNLQAGMDLLAKGEKVDKALKLINKSARKGTTKGKSFFEVGKIIREGMTGLDASLTESKRYFDQAMVHFQKDQPNDSLDYLEMGDYYFYELGTEPANREKALEYYRLALGLGDETAAERIKLIESDQDAVSNDIETEADKIADENASSETEETVEETKDDNVVVEETPAAEETEADDKVVVAANNDVEETPVAEDTTSTEETPVTEDTTSDDKVVVAANNDVEEDKASDESVESFTAIVPPLVVEQPTAEEVQEEQTVELASQEDKEAQRVVEDMDEGDQLLIKAIRLLDSPASTESDKRKGVEYVKAASDLGVMRASVLLAYLYEGENSVVKRDLDAAKKYYEIAIARGSATAEYRLGLLYLSTEPTYNDEEKGHQLILSSARRGYPYALNYVGDSFRTKVSDPRNLDLAYRYYSLAGERGLGLSYHNMAEIDASRQEIQLAQLHEKYATDNGYDAELGTQAPLFTTIRA